MPNSFAYLVFFSYPLIAWVLFRRLPVPAMVAATIIVGFLFLPTRISFDLPMMPALDRKFMPSLTALTLLYILHRQRQGLNTSQTQSGPYTVREGWLPKNYIILSLFGLFLFGILMTVLLNQHPITYGERRLPGLRPYDMFASVLSILVILTPFFLARRYLSTPRAHAYLLTVFCVCGLIYSLPTLYEVRMSPQLNRMFYGFFQTSWGEHLRGGGFRPVVFLQHGLHLGVFLTMAMIAALTLFRCAPRYRLLFLLAAIWILGTVFLAKTFGAFLIAAILFPISLLLGVRLQVLSVGLIMIVFLTYPLLRGAGLVPVDQIVDLIRDIDSQRAASLQFRLDNEEFLLEKANQQPLFGWGGWGRNRVFTEEGSNVAITDGYWLISLGLGGWVRYVAEFGLLSMSVLLLAFRHQKTGLSFPTASLCVMMTANILDLIPNAGIGPISWLVAGALAGSLETTTEDSEDNKDRDTPPDPKAGKPRYSRDHGPPKNRHRPGVTHSATTRAGITSERQMS